MKLPLFIWTGVSSTPTNWLLDDLVSYYKADTSGSFPDSHWSNNWTISGAIYTSSWKINWWYNFDWINDNINIWTMYSEFNWSSTISVSSWFNRQKLAPNHIFRKRSADLILRTNYNIWQNSWPSFLVNTNNWGKDIIYWTNTTIPQNAFYHYVWVFNWTSIKLYVNWVLQVSDTFAASTISWNNTNNLKIWANWTSQYSKWIIDETWFWNRELTQADVTALYNSWNWLSYDNFTS